MLALVVVPAVSGGVTPELQRAIRASTFEVVLKKPTHDPVSYEKPLPLELLPFVERTDPYQSVGTAFALGQNTYVTAAHVLTAAVDSQYGAPALRASDGKVHAIATVLKLSAHEDFVVFSLADDPNPPGFPTSRTPHVDDPVLAVGNALGDGIVIRDGLFTSETAEEQDGRWKWIRFSAAASPGNSGGPLLDAGGSVIGVVIAKSPNENLNYALPIANVLDATQSKAQFDQRYLTKLPFIQGSKTYTLKDEFSLPLNWAQFVRALQALMERNNDKARAELLSAYADSMFPRGSGTESILYGVDTTTREIGVAIQQANGTWTVDAPEFQFTDLPGDGRVGVAWAAGATLVSLHRGNESGDDAFFSDSKAFMDVALKALNVRRPVGTDHVRAVSLGAALSDMAATDAYGRKWQLRVWPLPFMDSYLVAQLLPTPDGYAGLVEYAPSAAVREAKIRLSLLANQVTLPYAGTIGQWRTFLARRAFLPETLSDVRLESVSGWKLHTRRFETSIPPALMKIDVHSKLLLTMGYMYGGSRVVWDVGGVWWYRDAQEKAYVGLWRQLRPPTAAKLELRNLFKDLEERHSPYDGVPVRDTADTLEVSTVIQAPGTKEGTASSDVAYGLTLRLDGHPSPQEVGMDQVSALQATRILERGIGGDIVASAPPTLSSDLDAQMKNVQQMAQRYDEEFGKDVRGRLFSQDVQEYVVAPAQAAFQIPLSSAGTTDHPSEVDAEKLQATFAERGQALEAYWHVASAVVHDRDLWRPFLIRNHLPEDTPHEPAVLAAESGLSDLMSKESPSSDWVQRARVLDDAYVAERRRIARKIASAGSAEYHQRKSACPAPVVNTSGTEKPRPGPVSHSLEEFYPPRLKRQGVQGLVVLSVRVNASGCPTEAAVVASSGSDELDAAALQWVDTAAFLPAERDGKPIEAAGPVAIDFKLQ
jgi:serine protease Do